MKIRKKKPSKIVITFTGAGAGMFFLGQTIIPIWKNLPHIYKDVTREEDKVKNEFNSFRSHESSWSGNVPRCIRVQFPKNNETISELYCRNWGTNLYTKKLQS